MGGALAERARRLLRGRGGRATTAELLAGLFGASADDGRWERLVESVLAPLPDVRQAPDGAWELHRRAPEAAAAPERASFVAMATAATGADPWRARLVAVAAVRVEAGQPVARFEAVVNPRCRVPGYVCRAAGLSQIDADEAPPFGELADELLDFLGDSTLVGLEIGAQVEAIGSELARLDRPGLRNRLLELAELAARAGLGGKPTLAAIAAGLGLTHPRPYRPSADARVAAQAAARLFERVGPDGCGSAVDWDAVERSPGPLRRPDPPSAPEGPGVYLLTDADGRVLYVGKARDLRRRVQAYHRRQLGLLRRLEGLAEAVARIETVAARSELEALLLEARLVREHQPLFNVQRRRRPPALFLRAALDGPASLGTCREPGRDGAVYLGPFRTASGASAALRLARALLPGLRGRARSGGSARQPLVGAALRFLRGDKEELIAGLQAEQRGLAASGEAHALARSRSLLRRAVAFTPDLATRWQGRLPDRLAVLSPAPSGGVVVHVVDHGRLIDCFTSPNKRRARVRARDVARTDPSADGAAVEALDERSILLRWLAGLGPEHEVLVPRPQRSGGPSS